MQKSEKKNGIRVAFLLNLGRMIAKKLKIASSLKNK